MIIKLSELPQIFKLGQSMDHLDQDTLANWLTQGTSTKVNYPNVAKEICQWIKAGNYDTYQELVDTLWAQTSFASDDSEAEQTQLAI